MKPAIATIAFVLLVLTAAPAHAQSVAPQLTTLPELSAAARAARLRGDAPAWLEYGRKALSLAPGHPDLLVSVARANAANGKMSQALAVLHEAATRGAGFDAAQFPEFQKEASAEFERIKAMAQANLAPVSRAQLFARVNTDSPVEGIAYDPGSKRFFVGAENGAILQIDERGVTSTFVPPGGRLLEVLGMKVDTARGLLWAANTVFPVFGGDAPPKPKQGVSGIVALRLSDGSIAHQAWLDERPKWHGFNDLTFAQDGTVFITDSLAAAVYRFTPSTATLELVVEDPGLSFINGIATAQDGRIYLAHAAGLSVLEPRTKRLHRVEVPGETAVNSIDGLVYQDGDLIGVQNSPYLARIVRIRLNPTGDAVKTVDVLNSRTPAEFNQTTAVGVGRDLFVIGGRPAVNSAGQPLAGKLDFEIYRIPL